MSSGITPLTPEQSATFQASVKQQSYLHRVLVAFDIFVNVLFMGHEDETISSRAARAATEGKVWGIVLSKFLDLFQANHGAGAEASDLGRAETVEYLEGSSGTLPK